MKIVIIVAALLLLTGCADNAAFIVTDPTAHVYGFWGGLWHGMIVPFQAIGSLFSDNIAVYAPSNSGLSYNIGFMIGCVSVGVGASSQ